MPAWAVARRLGRTRGVAFAGLVVDASGQACAQNGSFPCISARLNALGARAAGGFGPDPPCCIAPRMDYPAIGTGAGRGRHGQAIRGR